MNRPVSRIELKTREQVRWMREAALVVADIHQALRDAAQADMTTADLDAVSAETIRKAGAHSNFLNYFGYPATVCISVNDVVVHGIPGEQQLKAGDIVSFDCGAWVSHSNRQWHGDAAFSMIVGEQWISDEDFAAGQRCADVLSGDTPVATRRRFELNDVTRESLWAALAGLATGRRVNAVGIAVEEVVATQAARLGWEAGIIEEYTGHGIGTAMHQAPDVVNFRMRGIAPRLKPGMVLAVEPMLVTGSIETSTDSDEWTVRTVDHGDSAHWEHTVAILDDGIAVLTAPDLGAAGLAPYGVTPVEL